MVSSVLQSNYSPLATFLFLSLFFVYTTSFHGAGAFASSTSSFTVNVTENKDEAEALLNWKYTLDNHSQFLLSSWHGNNPCVFTGVACDDYGAVTHLNFSYLGLRGTLDGLDFSRITHVVSLELGNNSIYGSIPSSVGNLSKLNCFDLCGNELSGNIPLGIGSIPSEIGRLTSLIELDLSVNNFTGSIPCSLGNLTSLSILNLHRNDFTGPTFLAKFGNLTELDISKDALSGSMPQEIYDLRRLKRSIPFELGNTQFLEVLDLSHNMLNEDIPRELGDLRMLQVLNISHNNLCGSIAHVFGDALALTSIDVSYNDLEGPLPNVKAFIEAPFEAIQHNKGLCGNLVGLPKCNSTMNKKSIRRINTRIVVVLILSLLGFLLLYCTFTILVIINHHQRRIIKRENNERANDLDFMRILGYDGKVFYDRIVKATRGFDSEYYVGQGAYGIVYKAKISEDQMVAVKKISSSQEDSEIVDLIPFEREIQALRNIRHRNIVKFYGFCSHAQRCFLVYEYMERGSLRTIFNGIRE
ncbi:MDIS1-interacting receptor like kinase 2 [Eucalyptus grandis]|uniref:MDIS1-interacting receptor like kinase 2 n=1 Tax=Eucalyptus grandis TaxID=71139 RepID=UPI00192EA7FF|nr:MDIS1-interacting receptor like kinase 2 [Eucalyptus grandis]